VRHSGESRNPEYLSNNWIPVFTGMTDRTAHIDFFTNWQLAPEKKYMDK